MSIISKIRKSPLQNAEQRLILLKEEHEEMDETLTYLKERCRFLLRQTDNLDEDDYELRVALRDADIAVEHAQRQRENVMLKRREITMIEMEIETLKAEQQQKEEKKIRTQVLKRLEKGIFEDALLAKINGMPEDIVDYIGSFLPDDVVFAIKARDLEYNIRTRKLLDQCAGGKDLQVAFLKNCFSKHECLEMLPFDEEVQQFHMFPEEYAYDANFRPYVKVTYKAEAQYRIIRLIETAKKANPKFAFNILKTLHILIQPGKKYRRNYNFRPYP